MPALDSAQDFLDSSLSLGMTWQIDRDTQALVEHALDAGMFPFSPRAAK